MICFNNYRTKSTKVKRVFYTDQKKYKLPFTLKILIYNLCLFNSFLLYLFWLSYFILIVLYILLFLLAFKTMFVTHKSLSF